jgi:hypothetical protein
VKTERAIKNRQSIDTGNMYTTHRTKTNRINETFEKVMSYTDVDSGADKVMSYTDVESGADKGNKFLLEDVAGVCLKKTGIHNFFEFRHLVLKR